MNVQACLAAALLACTCAHAAPRATIELLPRAEVAGEPVLLGQVAHLSSPDLALMQQLVHLPIGRVPREGQPALVGRRQLARWIQRETGLRPDDLAWQGSDAARVARVTQHVKGSELALAAEQAVRAWLAQRGAAGAVRVARPPRDFDVPAGEVQLRPRGLDGVLPRNRMLVWVEVWADGAFVRAVPVALELEAPLLAAPATIAPTLTTFGRDRSAVLVERGGWATLRSTDGAVSLEGKVAVLQDGRAGDHVRVRAPGGGGIVFARVVGPAQLELAP